METHWEIRCSWNSVEEDSEEQRGGCCARHAACMVPVLTAELLQEHGTLEVP